MAAPGSTPSPEQVRAMAGRGPLVQPSGASGTCRTTEEPTSQRVSAAGEVVPSALVEPLSEPFPQPAAARARAAAVSIPGSRTLLILMLFILIGGQLA